MNNLTSGEYNNEHIHSNRLCTKVIINIHNACFTFCAILNNFKRNTYKLHSHTP